jgi:fructose-bisphosphate aldolase class I
MSLAGRTGPLDGAKKATEKVVSVDLDSMILTAKALVMPGKGILAADESTPTMAKRLAGIDVESTEQHRRAYREILFTTAGIGEFISGVILFDETIRQSAADGTPFPEVLRRQGVIPGIKVDGGTKPLAGFPDEVITEGLDGLRTRLAEYASLGARFAKWRAVIHIGDGRPTDTCVEANAHALARYAALAQEAGLVPIVEPEVLMDGAHTLERCAEVTVATLREVYAQLGRHRVVLEASLLKPNMVLPGKNCPVQADLDEIAESTIRALRLTVPAAVPGILFLSGGQSDEQATTRLDAMNRRVPQPWELSFSYGRALQGPVLRAWAGDDGNRDAAQSALLHRAELNGAARHGAYRPDMESRAASRG